MAEYIKREAVKKLVNNNFSGLLAAIDSIPAADVVEVVRCKDCYQSAVINDVFYCTYWRKNTELGRRC